MGLPGFWGFGVLGVRGFGGLASIFLFLIISFSRFQYFNLHFGSLKLCFTNLFLEIQDNLSLILLSSLEISNLIYFTHFRAIPHHYESYLKIQAQACPICQNSINPKQFRFSFYGHFSARSSLGWLMI